jgi:hypothetical protein
MDSSVSPTHGEQENSVWNGHYACTCYHPLFVFNQFGDLEKSNCRHTSGSPFHNQPGIAVSGQDYPTVLIVRERNTVRGQARCIASSAWLRRARPKLMCKRNMSRQPGLPAADGL